MNENKHKDQAEQLRKIVEGQANENNEEVQISSLPPRSEVHKNSKEKKKTKFKIKFPLIRLLLILFLILILLAVTSPMWLDKLR